MNRSRFRIVLGFLAPLLGTPANAQVTQRVSVNSQGIQGNSYGSTGPQVSADGRFVAFISWSTNLVPGDTNGDYDIFVRDRVNGMTERVNVDSNGAQANDYCNLHSISADGRYVGFSSHATNLVTSDSNGFSDAFIHDRLTGTTELVSVSSSGAQGNFPSAGGWVSADGRKVAFISSASNLAPGDAWPGITDVFVRDRVSGTTENVSVFSGVPQQPSDIWSVGASISADGRFVAFSTYADDQVPGDTDGLPDVFVRDLQTGTIECASIGSNGVQGGRASFGPSLSANGRYVAFSSFGANLVPGDANARADVFVRDRHSGTIELVSLGPGGLQGDGDSYVGSISADGRYVAFQSYATNLVPSDTNGMDECFVRDRLQGMTERVTVDSAGAQANSRSDEPCISADGRFVAFGSAATNLVPADANGAWFDVFVRDRLGGPTFASLCEPGSGGVLACPCTNTPAGSGRGCDNSFGTGGAALSASGGTFLSSDTLVFRATRQTPNALSLLIQGTGLNPTGAIFGMGVRCVSGTIKRLYTKLSAGGSVIAPDFDAGETQVSSRSAALGDTILAAENRWYLVYYRDSNVLGGCPGTSTFNATQTGQVTWSP